MSYLIRKEDVPIRLSIGTTAHSFSMLLGQKCIGREDICHMKSELISLTQYTFRGRFPRYRGKVEAETRKMVCEVSDRIYYVIDGEITNFQVGDEVYQKVTKGDIVFIPKGVPYAWDWAECEYMVLNGPAFVPGSDKIVE